MAAHIRINFNNGKYFQGEFSIASPGVFTQFLEDPDPVATLGLHSETNLAAEVDRPLGQARSGFVNGGYSLMLYREEVESIELRQRDR